MARLHRPGQGSTRRGARWRSLALGCAVALAAAAGPAGAQVFAVPIPDPKPGPVRDPHWGAALFDVYQDETFAALTGLMASQHFERVPLHADEAEVLRGGLLLDYGMHEAAGRIFVQLIDKGAAPSVRDRAWFHLARLRHQKGLNDASEQALQRIGKAMPRELEDRRLLLQAQLQLARGDHAAAALTLQAVPADSALLPYAQFNLGVAQIRAGDEAAGTRLLDALGQRPAASEDLRSLRDKANLALGFAALRAGQSDLALTALERIRLQGPQSHAALLGFGWASLQKQEPRRSLVAFRELAGRSLRDAPVLEAQIAQAHALAEAGAMGPALSAYEQATQVFAQEASRLDKAVVAARQGVLIEQLIGLDAPQRLGSNPSLAVGPAVPQAGFLVPLLAQHELQESLRNLRDLRFAAANLAEWAGKLAVFDDMLAQRRLGFEQRLPQVRGRAGSLDVAAQQARLAQLGAELAQAQTAADGQAFADERERALRERMAQVMASLSQLDPAERDAARERLRLAEGALIWQLARDYPARLWSARKHLEGLHQGLNEAAQRLQILEQAQREEPVRLQAFAARIAEIRLRVASLAPQVAVLAAEQQSQAQELAAAELQRQHERLAGYEAQARWAIAQLHDRARLAQAPGAADVTR